MNVVDDEGLPPEGIEHKLAHFILGRENTLAKNVLYSLLGGPRRYAELMAYSGKSPNNLTQVLALLRSEALIIDVTDARTSPAQIGYKLTTFGLVVVDWMRRYEFLADLVSTSAEFAHPA